MFARNLLLVIVGVACGLNRANADSVVFDGRLPLSYSTADIDASANPYLTVVKGSEAASHYSQPLGTSVPPTPLSTVQEQALSITIDGTSIFLPGGSNPQNGFRRTDFIAQNTSLTSSLTSVTEVGVTKFHFSIRDDPDLPLNLTHEYQIVFIEPSDGTHVFDVQLGSPFTNPTAQDLPVADAASLRVRDHASDVLFSTAFTNDTWHNFAVQVDWDQLTLQVFYSTDGNQLESVTDVIPNNSVAQGSAGQGDFHIAVLKLPLVDPSDSAADQNDVVHFGIQENTHEGLFYSGVFVESISS
ncbi:hypothetical protein K435DRAFT_806507 [Dendrothele bispora CBS 962.96]|uniref:Glycoside hydrolase 131 catalytic N-terminal domain-containing protein n=1 Tax=Dendrothele bispora (strain CBS 962.96) TaxID=1314807 RepID=A0A4S8L7M2_DENBC|nr:hypothetical protein K435DRAFT_806507 [Dendrothele bispora CBS 962.96]